MPFRLPPIPNIAALSVLTAVPLACAAQTEPPATPLMAPLLGAVSNFGQGNQPGVLENAIALGLTDLRDGLYWDRVETTLGEFEFDGPQTTFPDEILSEDLSLSLTLNWGHPLFEDGATPTTPEGIAAFGAFAGVLAERFPDLDAVEIGNEFNGVDFVRGPLKDVSPEERAKAHAQLLAAASEAARGVRDDIRILGGASHSIPLAYLWAVLDAGGGDHMDALALHPYTTPPEQLARQIEVLRRHPAAADMPIEITEFGSSDPEAAASYMLRDYCQMALSGVTRAVWYPLTPRGDGLVPLMEKDGRLTGAGRAFRAVQKHFAEKPVTGIDADPFTYGCRFGEDAMLLWGEPREVTVTDTVEIFDAEGQPLDGPQTLSRDAPLILQAAGPIALGDQVKLGDQELIADSFDQFGYPSADGAPAPTDPFERLIRVDGQETALSTMPGQEASGTLWTPYLGDKGQRPLRLTAEQLLPGGSAERPVEIVHRYVATEAMEVALEATFEVAERSDDGIAVRLLLNDEELETQSGKAAITMAPEAISLAAGDRLEIAVGPDGNANGDVTRYRITLRAP